MRRGGGPTAGESDGPGDGDSTGVPTHADAEPHPPCPPGGPGKAPLDPDPFAGGRENRASGARGKIFVLYNTTRWLYRFRLPLMEALRDRGYTVCGVSPQDEYVRRLEARGFPHLNIPMNRKGTNPVEDGLLVARLHGLFRRERPDLILTYTVKPNVYGSLAARPLGIPVVNTVAGLGAMFVRPSLATRVAKRLYRHALARSSRVFFQNREDLNLFVEGGLVRAESVAHVPGSGVNTAFFKPLPKRANGGRFVFLYSGRFLWDKGLGELVEASALLRQRGVDAECRLLGFFDPGNPQGIPRKDVMAWVEQGLITHLGEADEVVDHIREADCMVLPSYREGLPRSLLEAASMGKPLIAADAPGSRDLVTHGVNGFLCRVRDSLDLAEKMEAMIRLSGLERERMGRAGRERVLREFDESLVIQRYVAVVEAALAGRITGDQPLIVGER